MEPELRRALHAQADDIDIAALTGGKVLDGYGLLIDMGVDGLVAVEIGGEEQLPLLLRNLPWAAQGLWRTACAGSRGTSSRPRWSRPRSS
ncbi:hypothetical protein NKG05_09515 [Oerskovia sp. M15]